MKAYERLLKYAVIKTPSDETSTSIPSSACQFDLANLLKKEMEDSIPNWNKTVTKSQKWAAGAPGAIEADVTVNENGGTSVIYPSTDTFKAYMAESGSSTGTETTSKPENKDKKDGE